MSTRISVLETFCVGALSGYLDLKVVISKSGLTQIRTKNKDIEKSIGDIKKVKICFLFSFARTFRIIFFVNTC